MRLNAREKNTQITIKHDLLSDVYTIERFNVADINFFTVNSIFPHR